jgi:hypothetical protein
MPHQESKECNSKNDMAELEELVYAIPNIRKRRENHDGEDEHQYRA